MDFKQIIEKNALAVAAAAFIFGLLLGWMVLGWVIAPVQYVDAGPENLSDFFKVLYVQMVADSYGLSGNVEVARERISYLGEGANTAIQLAMANTTGTDNLRVANLAAVVGATGGVPGASGGDTGGSSGATGLLRSVLPICAVGLFLLLVVGGAFIFLRMRRANATANNGDKVEVKPRLQQRQASAEGGAMEAVVTEAGDVLLQRFKTTYTMGNDLYDESFAVDDAQGDFLGECGVGIGETIGVGDPKKVTAFEVWLFDKNDIRTVTKVLMSEHAFRDEALKSRLAAKGEPVMAHPGDVIAMETATLRVQARIVEMQYGSGALPPNSFFQQLSLEINVYRKSE